MWVALRIAVTLPVTVASAERSFSKLKLLKTCLRPTMSQERLNGLALMSINQDVSVKYRLTIPLKNLPSESPGESNFNAMSILYTVFLIALLFVIVELIQFLSHHLLV